MMDIRPVKTEEDYEHALTKIEKLWGAKEGSDEGDMLDVLIVLVEDYEAKHYPVDLPDPVEAVKFRMEQNGLKQADLVSCFGGSRSRVSEFLSRRRELTKEQIRNLHKELKIPLECLYGDFVPA